MFFMICFFVILLFPHIAELQNQPLCEEGYQWILKLPTNDGETVSVECVPYERNNFDEDFGEASDNEIFFDNNDDEEINIQVTQTGENSYTEVFVVGEGNNVGNLNVNPQDGTVTPPSSTNSEDVPDNININVNQEGDDSVTEFFILDKGENIGNYNEYPDQGVPPPNIVEPGDEEKGTYVNTGSVEDDEYDEYDDDEEE